MRLGVALFVALVLMSCSDEGSDDGEATSTTAAEPDSVITVDDPSAVGEVGDGRLSFAEAIRVANGSLATEDLSDAESAGVDGDPGAGRADEVRFEVAGDRVEVPAQEVPDGAEWEPVVADTLLPVLQGNDGDRFVGDGVSLANGPEGAPIGGLALRVASSDVAITGFRMERFAEMVGVQPVDAGGISGVELSGNAFLDGGGVSLAAVALDGAKSELAQVTIHDNELLGPPEFGGRFPRSIHSAVGATGAPMTAAGAEGRATISDLAITDNVVKGFQGGFTISALQSSGGNRGGALAGVHIEGNDVEMPAGAGDPAIYVWGAVNLGGAVEDVRVSDVRIVDNVVAGNGYVVLVTGVEQLLRPDTTVAGVEVRGVEVSGNRIAPSESCSIGVLVMGAFTEMGGGPAEGVAVDHVAVRANEVEGCETGMLVTPVLNWGTSGTSRGNEMTSVEVDGNDITGAEHAVVVTGGTVLATTLAYEDAADAGVEGNAVRDLTVAHESDRDEAEVVVAGGLGWGAPGSVTANTVEVRGVDVSGTARCRVEADASIDSSATVTGNVVDGGRC